MSPATWSGLWPSVLCLRTLRPLVIGDLRRRLELGLFYYAYLRPHQALGGATPAEIYFASTPVHLAAVHPPRGKPGQGPRASPFEIRFLDPEQQLPLLVPKAA